MLDTIRNPSGLVAVLTRDILANAAANRQGVGRGAGDRPAPSLAAGPVDVRSLTETRRDASGAPIEVTLTEPGQRTALRRDPPALAKFSRDDPRRCALVAYASAVERIGGSRGASISAESAAGRASPSQVPDGGATTRIKHVSTARLARGAVNRWPWSDERRAFVEGQARPVLAARRGKARTITATDLLDAVAIEGLDMSALLVRFGWSNHSKHRKELALAFEDMLDDLADALGFGNRLPGR